MLILKQDPDADVTDNLNNDTRKETMMIYLIFYHKGKGKKLKRNLLCLGELLPITRKKKGSYL